MTRFDDDDRAFMARALELAERGLYTTTPNPRVGCVIVQGDAVIGEGWHARAGGAHAEVAALAEHNGYSARKHFKNSAVNIRVKTRRALHKREPGNRTGIPCA